MIKDNKAILKWNSANRKRYVDIGYEFTQWGDEFLINVEDLTKTSRASITVICDYCGLEFPSNYKKYNHNLDRSIIKKDSCSRCVADKRKEDYLIKYGKESVNQVEEVKNKKKQSYIKRYGVENPSQSKEIKDKVKNTFIKNYGVNNIFMSKNFIKTITGENHYAWKGGLTPLSNYLRGKSFEWKQESLKIHNYTCFVAGIRGVALDIHHAYNFKNIFDETIEELNVDIKPKIVDYTCDELNLIVETFLLKQNEYGYGYPMTKEAHIEFHKMYGSYNNNLDQLLEFKDLYIKKYQSQLVHSV